MNFSKKQNFYAKNASVLFLAASMAACGGGGVEPTAVSGTVTTAVSGTVTAPAGDIAFNQKSTFQRFASAIIGEANAAVTGVKAVGAGVTVELIEVDASGNQVGDVIESTTTDADGKYTINTVKPASGKFIIRVTGTTESMDVRYTGTTNDVDPVTDAVSDLITAVTSDLSTISTDEILEIADVIEDVVQNIDPTGLSAAALATAIKNEANDNEEISNQLTSSVSAEKICGNIKDAAGANLGNIRVIIKDYNEGIVFAKSKTDSSGNYCANVAAGDYIIGAFNFTTTSTAASEWWSTSGTKYTPFDATKVTVAAAATVTKDFALEAGARLTGKITTAEASSLVAGAGFEGAKIIARQYSNYLPIAGKRVKADGTYVLNVIPGDYRIQAKNGSRFDYASEIYNGGTGTSFVYEGTKVTLTAGNTTTIDIALDKGYKVYGQILDGPSGSPVKGQRVALQDSGTKGSAFLARTNKKGKYRVWVKSGTYKFQSYGSSETLTVTSNTKKDLAVQVGKVTLTVKDGSGNPISQAKVFLTDSTAVGISYEITKADGTATLYSATTATDNKIYLRVDGSFDYASSVHSGKTRVRSGDNISMTVGTTTTPFDMTLPTAGTLKVIVTTNGTTPVGNYRVQMRSGGTAGSDKFITGRTLSNGQFELSVPAGTYEAVRMIDSLKNCTNVVVTAGATKTLNFNTGTGLCS